MASRVETEQVRETVEQLHGAITVQSMADQRVAVTLALPQTTVGSPQQ
jgi:chemotaxis protein histidine kinase CheA